LLVGAVGCGMRVAGAEIRPEWAADAQDWVRQTMYSSLTARMRLPTTTQTGQPPIGPPPPPPKEPR
jgi:hypothetical protein